MTVKSSTRTAFIVAAIALAAPLAPGPVGSADATEILFTIDGTGGDPNATFNLPESPTPDSFNPGGSFTFDSIPAVVGGMQVTLQNLAFFNSAALGGFMDSAFYNLTGAQLYSGAEGSPMFVPGVYQLTSFSGNADTLTLSVASVPELSTWALMLVGFAGIGLAARWRGKKLSPALVG